MQPTLHCGHIKRSCGEQGSARLSLTSAGFQWCWTRPGLTLARAVRAQLTASSIRSKLDLERIIRSLKTKFTVGSNCSVWKRATGEDFSQWEVLLSAPSVLHRPLVAINSHRAFNSSTEFDYKVINTPFDDQNRGWIIFSVAVHFTRPL